MSPDSLLLWMSARREGSWQQFRTAVEELHVGDGDPADAEDDDAPDQFALPLYQSLRLNLQRLGHAEFFAGAGDTDWRVTPPSLAITPRTDGWFGVLAGARSSRLLELVKDAATSTQSTVLSLPDCPNQFLFASGAQEDLVTLAERAGLLLQRDAPAALLTCLPPIDDPSVRSPFPMPFGAEWRVDRFSPETFRWHSASRDQALSASSGLFRFSLHHQRYVLFCSRGSAFRVPGPVGKFLVLRRRRMHVIRYDRIGRRLTVPASCRPPFLIERALILCSGSLPSYESAGRTGVLAYVEIPESIAAIAMSLLRQEPR